jgi:DNA-binding response OmpR family regulator
MPRVLIVDDDAKLCRLIGDYLQPLGFDTSAAHSGLEGLDRALAEPFDAVILDLMLPGIDGYEVLRRLRAHTAVPVLMLTGRGDEADRIVGLEMGADDYLPKTFSTRELLARLRAVLRRADSAAPPAARLAAGGLCVDTAARSASVDGKPVGLTKLEFDILASLVRARGRVKTREQLLDDIGDREFDVFDRSIDVHVASLRRKLGDNPKAPRFIETIRGTGYAMRWPGTQ